VANQPNDGFRPCDLLTRQGGAPELSSNAIKDGKSRYKPGRLEDPYHLTKPYELKDLLEKLQEAFLSREGRAS